MEVTFADSFWKSLKRMSRHQTWWYKTYEVFRYKIPMFFENLWFFRKELWYFRSWDYTFNLKMFSRSLEKTANTLEFHGDEIEVSRMKKVTKIKRVIQIIDNLDESNYTNRAELEIGELKNLNGWWDGIEDTEEEKEHNRKVFELARKIEEDEWKELCLIIKGQNHEEFEKIYNNLDSREKFKHNYYEEWFDGSGMKNWWD